MIHGDDLFVVHPNAQEQRIRELRAEAQRTEKLFSDSRMEVMNLRAEVDVKDKQLKAQRLVSDAIIKQLREEAHDKHWPLANACRNLLPPAETNIEQVRLVAEELDQLQAELTKCREAHLEVCLERDKAYVELQRSVNRTEVERTGDFSANNLNY